MTGASEPLSAPWRLPLNPEPYGPGPHKPSECPVCGAWWRPYPGSHLPGHGKCLWTDDAARALITDPRHQYQLAADIGVSISVIRAGYRVGYKLADKEGAGHAP